jgi:transposase
MFGNLSCMKLLDELARTDIDAAMLLQVQSLIEQQQAKVVEADDKLTRLHTVVAEKDFKIKALMFDLAYCKLVCFGKASEALVGERRHEPDSCQCGPCGADLVKIG